MTTFSRGKWLGLLCLLPFAVFFIVFQIAPLLWVAIHSLQSDAGWGWENFIRAFSSKFYRQAIQYSLEPIRCARWIRGCAISSTRSPT